MPTTMSRCSRATAAARSGSAYGRWLSSPMSRYASPIAEMLTKARMRVRARLATNSRSPSKRPAPALPASTREVTPLLAHTASVPAPEVDRPLAVDGQPGTDRGHPSGAEADVHHPAEPCSRVEDGSAREQEAGG